MHACNYVGRIRYFHPYMCYRRANRTHAEGDNKHRSAPHTAMKKRPQLPPHLLGVCPVVRWASLLFGLAADKSSTFDSGNVRWIGSDEIAIRSQVFIEFFRYTSVLEKPHHLLKFFWTTVANSNCVWLTKFLYLLDPEI